ncbi:protease SohB [Photobacterium kishitanii]|uniref:Protease SohB n=1 Tax=Photobacterium kishitanii TaxID=318456 RepID=A0A2T3KLL5_9GAMM|nr:protease SohB [Photobacterium kishitanii]PSV00537.1 protease SohB [Photobacterium kishitanii]
MKNLKEKKIIISDISERISSNAEKLVDASHSTSLIEKIRKTLNSKTSARDEGTDKPTTWLLTFDGDTSASEVNDLSVAITAIIRVKSRDDRVIVKMNSGGGTVNGYGLVAAELLRLKENGIHLTVCIDLVAASGGYLAACVADKIVAAPFSYIGSIGVVVGVPNYSKLLNRYGIEYIQETAGESKRSITPFTPPTEKEREDLKKKLETIHADFKKHVAKHRNIDENDANFKDLFNGDYWVSQHTVEKGMKLIDEVKLSSDLIMEESKTRKVLEITFESPKKKQGLIKTIAAILTQSAIDGSLEAVKAKATI